MEYLAAAVPDAFDIRPSGEERSIVEAKLTAPVSGAMRLFAPILRAQVGRQLAAALVEDRDDLESGRYGE